MLNIPIRQPKINLSEKIENNCFENDEQQLLDSIKLQTPDVSHELIRLTQAQVGNKKEEVETVEDTLYEWVKETHLECLKTEVIFN